MRCCLGSEGAKERTHQHLKRGAVLPCGVEHHELNASVSALEAVTNSLELLDAGEDGVGPLVEVAVVFDPDVPQSFQYVLPARELRHDRPLLVADRGGVDELIARRVLLHGRDVEPPLVREGLAATSKKEGDIFEVRNSRGFGSGKNTHGSNGAAC